MIEKYLIAKAIVKREKSTTKFSAGANLNTSPHYGALQRPSSFKEF